MAIEKVFPFVERSDYQISSWIGDLVNIIKKRGFLMKKEDGFLVFQENSAEFLADYADGLSPMQSYLEYEGEG